MTLTGVDDYRDDGDQVTAVTFAIDAANSEDQFDAVASQSINATTTDDDVAGFTVAVTGGQTEVGEVNPTDTFSVVLNAQPVADVVITVVVGNPSEVAVVPASLTFTAANWNQAQTVTVSGVNDFVLDGDKTSVITLRIDDAASDNVFDPVADQTLSVKTLDDDVAGFTVTPTGGSTRVTEAATTDTFSVALTAQPQSNVVLQLVISDATEATLSTATLTFTPANWNLPQVVTVTGVDDALIDGDVTSTITLNVDDAASDVAFATVPAQNLSVVTQDDDGAGVTVTESGGATSVTEAGSTDTFTVVLGAQPASNVVLHVTSGDPGEATADYASLTFTPANWNVPQTVTVHGIDDAVKDGDQTTAVTVAVVAAQSDDAFDGVAPQTVSVVTTDDDVPGVGIAETGGNTSVADNGATDTFAVVLNAQPASNVVLNDHQRQPRFRHGRSRHADVHAGQLERAAGRDRDGRGGQAAQRPSPRRGVGGRRCGRLGR